ncbi:glycosyltransferase family 61 protein [Williamsia sp. MIQD14]|uniref:glycosyltransferase family 61 protein n=1 Tax=Williamsia sp. MIQD14 TaxID=3425703 RepID=UPI003DA12A87
MADLIRASIDNYGTRRLLADNNQRLRWMLADLVDRALRRHPADLSDHVVEDFSRIALSMHPAMYDEETLHEDESFVLGDAGVPTTEVFGRYTYGGPELHLYGEPLDAAEVYERTRRVHPAGVAVREARFDEVILYRNAVYLRRDGVITALYESARSHDRVALQQPTAADLRLTRTLPDHPDTVYLGSPGSSNFGHWLTDDLSRAVAAAASTAPGTSPRWVMTDRGTLINQRRQESLGLALGEPDVEVTLVPFERPVVVRDVRYMSQPTLHPMRKSPDAIAASREAVVARLSPRPVGPGTRLHILRRGGAAGRRIVNGAEIEELLARRGFVTLDPITASAREQAEACLRADVIVGVMGAAMVNSIFSPHGTSVIHLAASGWTEPYYADLAAACGHTYSCVYGPTVEAGSAWLVPFTIDVDEVERALDRVDQMQG